MRRMNRAIWLGSVSAVVLLGACDPLSFLDQPGSKKNPAASATRTRAWTCQNVLSPSVLLLEDQGRPVTVALEHVTVINPYLRQRVTADLEYLTAAQIQALYAHAHTITTQLLGNATVTLDPLPGYTDKRWIARVLAYSLLDVGEHLLDAGVATVTANSARAIPSSYYAAQQHAMQREIGLWAVDIPLPRRFRLVTGAFFDDLNKHAARPADHSEKDAEESARANLRCTIVCDLTVLGAPKKYNAVLAWRAVLLQNELSGPLDSLRPAEDMWDSLTLSLSGGLHTNITLMTDAHELTRVTRATRHVYTGEIITGYDLCLRVDDQEVYSTRTTLASQATLGFLR